MFLQVQLQFNGAIVPRHQCQGLAEKRGRVRGLLAPPDQAQVTGLARGQGANPSLTGAEQGQVIVVSDQEIILSQWRDIHFDDLGAGRITEWTRDVLHEIIAHRYNHRLPIVMTSNCPIGDEDGAEPGARLSLTARLGDALMSRLFEMCRILRFDGEDYRKQVLNARIARH